MVEKYQKKYSLNGWRKLADWRRDLKIKVRILGKACSSGGKGKQERIKQAASAYLDKSIALYSKIEASKISLPQTDQYDQRILKELEKYMALLKKHIDLVERRLIKDEQIPHEEKLFSIFETYTEWINKGKMRPSVELGKKLSITTDQHNLIVDYYIMENQSDSEIVPEIVNKLSVKFNISSWSFDKGYWNKGNKILLDEKVETPVLPKKGKSNKSEYEEEHTKKFKKLRNRHSAIESNINELEHRGLNRCPDKGYKHFKRYIGLAVSAYNLCKIGKWLIDEKQKSIEGRSFRKTG